MGVTGEDSGSKASEVSMDDLKKLEHNLRSSMDSQMEELHDMMSQLLQKGNIPASPPLEENTSAGLNGEGEGTKESPSKIDGGKAEYNAVPLVYSPDAPIPHPHINNTGDPPKLIVRDMIPGTPELVTSRTNRRHKSINVEKKFKQI